MKCSRESRRICVNSTHNKSCTMQAPNYAGLRFFVVGIFVKLVLEKSFNIVFKAFLKYMTQKATSFLHLAYSWFVSRQLSVHMFQ